MKLPRLPIILLLALAAVLLLAPATAFADPPTEEAQAAFEDAPRRLFSPEHRQELYEANRLSEGRALVLSAALPGLGNFYAEQYAMGVVALSALIFSGVFVGYGLVNNQRGLASFGIGLAVVTYGTALGSSYYGVRVYNDRLRRSLHVP